MLVDLLFGLAMISLAGLILSQVFEINRLADKLDRLDKIVAKHLSIDSDYERVE